MQQACSIIQTAAHEDANIIFGAVLDEKMEDGVKITVIATGFREIPTARARARWKRARSFAAVHDEAMEFPDTFDAPMPDPPKHIMSRTGDADEPAERAYEAEPDAGGARSRGGRDFARSSAQRAGEQF